METKENNNQQVYFTRAIQSSNISATATTKISLTADVVPHKYVSSKNFYDKTPSECLKMGLTTHYTQHKPYTGSPEANVITIVRIMIYYIHVYRCGCDLTTNIDFSTSLYKYNQ